MPSSMIKATIASTALSGASNFLAQSIGAYRDNKPFMLDSSQLLRFALVTMIDAPPNYKWQQLLESSFPGYERSLVKPQTDIDVEKQRTKDLEQDGNNEEKLNLNIRNTIIKMVIDCTVGAMLNTVGFFILIGLLKGESGTEIWYNIRQDTFSIIINGSKVWPLASLISFSCVPVERRVVFLSFVNLIWGIYMSMVAMRA